MALFAKKETDQPRAAEHGPAEMTLESLVTGLGQMAETLVKTNQRIAEYLARHENQTATRQKEQTDTIAAQLGQLMKRIDQLGQPRPAQDQTPAAAPAGGETLASLLEPLNNKLSQLEKKLETLAGNPPAETTAQSSAAADILDAINQHNNTLRQTIQQLQQQLASRLEQIDQLLRPPEPEEQPPVSSAQWQRAILGPDLTDNPALAFQREELIHGVLEGDPAACGLAGQLLVFQSAPPERMPQLLKEIGEAFYRWQPKQQPGTTPMEEALVAWLHRRCEAAGIYNTIELVHPGQRYDAARHNATSRGVEITQVHGWIVLRDNGRVYMKATVSVR